MLPAIQTPEFAAMLHDQVEKRRTFAIISHPDAGKTTLTEKLLLYGGAIRSAGSVKARKSDKHATSDWMDIEKQRGISVTSSAMQFEFNGFRINILDTPGHQDFSEDTYRVLVAADAAVMLIDAAKGVEAQTIKLFKVCRMRGIPIFTFVNKMDRAAKDPFALMEELEQVLGIRSCPVNWPIGVDGDFQGVYHRDTRIVELYTGGDHGKRMVEKTDIPVDDPLLENILEKHYRDRLMEEIALLDEAGDPFDLEAVRRGELTPMFFGSAVTNFGVEPFLERFLQYTPPPLPRKSDIGDIQPEEPYFSGFIFKIHANMDPNHRDRIAFLKICSGVFERNKSYLHVPSGKGMKFAAPTAFMAEKKSVIDEAFPGDIVGLHDTGNFKIGDTFTEGEKLRFTGIPSFSPELFRYIENADPMKFKQLAKGVDQLMDEGVAQLFTSKMNGRKIIGTVGALQFEVIEYRLEHEYGAKCRYEPIQIHKACWIESDNREQLEDFRKRKYNNMALDKRGREVFLADTSYALSLAMEKFPDIKFHFTSEF